MLSKLTHIFMESTKEKALLCQLWLPTCLHHSLVGPWGLGALCATYHGFSSCFFFLWGLSSGKTSGCFLKIQLIIFFLLEFIIIPQEPMCSIISSLGSSLCVTELGSQGLFHLEVQCGYLSHLRKKAEKVPEYDNKTSCTLGENLREWPYQNKGLRQSLVWPPFL